MTYREQTLAELSLSQIPHREAEGRAGLPEVHITTDDGPTVIMVFTHAGYLVCIEVKPEAEEGP